MGSGIQTRARRDDVLEVLMLFFEAVLALLDVLVDAVVLLGYGLACACRLRVGPVRHFLRLYTNLLQQGAGALDLSILLAHHTHDLIVIFGRVTVLQTFLHFGYDLLQIANGGIRVGDDALQLDPRSRSPQSHATLHEFLDRDLVVTDSLGDKVEEFSGIPDLEPAQRKTGHGQRPMCVAEVRNEFLTRYVPRVVVVYMLDHICKNGFIGFFIYAVVVRPGIAVRLRDLQSLFDKYSGQYVHKRDLEKEHDQHEQAGVEVTGLFKRRIINIPIVAPCHRLEHCEH
mmetsp:Transcript_51084/g.142919  ORF Transcript_51084/g.142919 Transcript_51084/m.142919 type:complete len:285 (+) Transcript_51084:497-1351(+)